MSYVEERSEWRAGPEGPKVPFTIRGHSRARVATGFEIPEWGLFLDAGLDTRKQPRAVLVTHSHPDHVQRLPGMCYNRDDSFNVFCNASAAEPIRQYLLACKWLQASKTTIQWNDRLWQGKIVPIGPEEGWLPMCDVYQRSLTPRKPPAGRHRLPEWKKRKLEAEGKGPKPPPTEHPNAPEVTRKLMVRGVKLKHTVDAMGFVVASRGKRLLPKYAALRAKLDDAAWGVEVRRLRAAKEAIEGPCLTPQLAIFCDCSSESACAEIDAVCGHPDGAPKVILVECTYVDDAEAEEAQKRRHVLWSKLKPTVLKHPGVRFLLIHLSLRYSPGEIAAFAKTLPPHVEAPFA